MSKKRVLIIDDEYFEYMEDDYKEGLEKFDFILFGETDHKNAIAKIKQNKPDVVLLDILFPDGKWGKPTLEKIRSKYPHLPVIMLTSTMADDEYNSKDYELSGYEYAKEGLKNGDFSDLALQIKNAIEEAEKAKIIFNDFGLKKYGFIVGVTEAMHSLAKKIEMVSKQDYTVLITGEPGTGKELVANAIHNLSSRSNNMFQPIVCAALPKDLIESELFGIEKGVATNVSSRIGLLEQANGGTVFLDEIGDIPKETQIKKGNFIG